MIATRTRPRPSQATGTSTAKAGANVNVHGPLSEPNELGASAPEANGPPAEFRMDRIAKRAHEIYEAGGREDGRAMEHWLQAESEIGSGEFSS